MKANEAQLKVVHAFVLGRMAEHATAAEELRSRGPKAIPRFHAALGAKDAFIEMRHLLERSFPDVDWKA